jgi:glycosyltransferase involved in cell wall biosynthesis
MSSYNTEIAELSENGFCVIENVLTTEEVETSLGYFRTWFSSHPQIAGLHNKISPHGIFKYHEVGQQRHAWYIRTRENVQNVLVDREGVDSSKVKLINHGFELEKFVKPNPDAVKNLKLKYNPNSKFPVIGVIARFTEWKGVHFIISSFHTILESYPNALLILANAKGDMKDEIDLLLSDLPSESYLDIPFENDLFSLYQLFDVYVHVPIDKYSEAFGQTYVEALAAGIPSVFTLSGIANEFIVDRKNALVVPYKSSIDITNAVMELLSNDSLREKVIYNGRLAVLAKFGIHKMIDSLTLLYET